MSISISGLVDTETLLNVVYHILESFPSNLLSLKLFPGHRGFTLLRRILLLASSFLRPAHRMRLVAQKQNMIVQMNPHCVDRA